MSDIFNEKLRAVRREVYQLGFNQEKFELNVADEIALERIIKFFGVEAFITPAELIKTYEQGREHWRLIYGSKYPRFVADGCKVFDNQSRTPNRPLLTAADDETANQVVQALSGWFSNYVLNPQTAEKNFLIISPEDRELSHIQVNFKMAEKFFPDFVEGRSFYHFAESAVIGSYRKIGNDLIICISEGGKA